MLRCIGVDRIPLLGPLSPLGGSTRIIQAKPGHLWMIDQVAISRLGELVASQYSQPANLPAEKDTENSRI
ncbi:hypothetical protein N656DRAFT_783250 [Canariomyces notabilis]|uniref:Uncharacterized protein n=1 Tax=Canariomyces notabilis TaxID=2074819 RepID=A0AAN6T9J6_9PEZI|nr:hypothetical protein N656DRAFT_783250 [Canariomyces arenarius]